MSRILVFGEALFDCLPDGEEILGGAPFNVAWNLAGFGEACQFISRVGNDVRGKRVSSRMIEWGMETDGVQHDDSYPTGVALITLEHGHPSFDLKPEQAYDYIRSEEVEISADSSLLYHGTLALRNEVSREALEELRESSDLPVFVDLNLREPWWDRSLFGTYLNGANWVKLSDEELTFLSGMQTVSLETQVEAAIAVAQKYALTQVIVTRGEQGAFVTDSEKLLANVAAHDIGSVVDTVGAGDAFSSVLLTGISRNWPLEETLNRAAAFAADICAISGATTLDKEVYQNHSMTWSQ
jgi:fructokinase